MSDQNGDLTGQKLHSPVMLTGHVMLTSHVMLRRSRTSFLLLIDFYWRLLTRSFSNIEAIETMESKKAHIKNLSDYNLTRDEINLLSRGLNYIPTPVTNDSHIRKSLLKDFAAFERRMRLQFIFHGRDKKPHPFHVKSNWEPPVQPSVALETYLEEVKTQLAEIQISKPKTTCQPRNI